MPSNGKGADLVGSSPLVELWHCLMYERGIRQIIWHYLLFYLTNHTINPYFVSADTAHIRQ